MTTPQDPQDERPENSAGPEPSPDGSKRDWDAEFRRITEDFDHRDDSADKAQRAGDSPVPGFRPEWRLGDPGHVSPPSPRDYEVADEEDEDDFIPPEPTPLDADDPATLVMIGALVAGPLWLVYLTVFDREARAMWWIAACLLVITGFVMAVVRQPKNREEQDPWDDGSRL